MDCSELCTHISSKAHMVYFDTSSNIFGKTSQTLLHFFFFSSFFLFPALLYTFLIIWKREKRKISEDQLILLNLQPIIMASRFGCQNIYVSYLVSNNYHFQINQQLACPIMLHTLSIWHEVQLSPYHVMDWVASLLLGQCLTW